MLTQFRILDVSGQLGVFEPPRELLDAIPGVELTEMERSGEDALCCGTSGFVHCDAVSRHLQAQRLQGAVDTGAERLLTSCPKCLLHFRCAQTEDSRQGRPVKNIVVEDMTVYLAGLLTECADAKPSDEPAPSQTGERS